MDIINESKINEARKKIDKFYKNKEKIIVIAKDDEFNRKILENKKVDYLIDLESGNKKDRLKQRDSGLNQVLCKLARENGIIIGIDLKNLNIKDDFVKSSYLARLIQNIFLCKKYKVNMVLVNIEKTNKKDLNGLLLTLGMSTSMAKYALEHSFSFS